MPEPFNDHLDTENVQKPHLEKPNNANAEFYVANINDAIERALYGDGLAIVDRVGASNLDVSTLRAGAQDFLANKKRHWRTIDGLTQLDGLDGFRPEATTGILGDILGGWQKADDFFAANILYNIYQPGGQLAEHVDFEEIEEDELDEEALSFIYSVLGEKQLKVTLRSDTGQLRSVVLSQTPDMLIVLRGGTIAHQDTLLIGLPHSVPPVQQAAEVFTFELMPKK